MIKVILNACYSCNLDK